jgi:hypothetical protein
VESPETTEKDLQSQLVQRMAEAPIVNQILLRCSLAELDAGFVYCSYQRITWYYFQENFGG